MIDETFLTTEEVLEYLQVNLRTVYRLIKAGKIPAVRVRRQWRVPRSRKYAPALPPTAPGGATPAPPPRGPPAPDRSPGLSRRGDAQNPPRLSAQRPPPP